MTALTWGLFMGVSSNVRYQVVFGLERVVDKTVARRVPQVGFLASDVYGNLLQTHGSFESALLLVANRPAQRAAAAGEA